MFKSISHLTSMLISSVYTICAVSTDSINKHNETFGSAIARGHYSYGAIARNYPYP